jgi:hypothetical protein
MQEITYRKQKAYLLTTDDLFELDKHPTSSIANEITYKVSASRQNGVKHVFIITSLRKHDIPIWLRSLITDDKNCFVAEIE